MNWWKFLAKNKNHPTSTWVDAKNENSNMKTDNSTNNLLQLTVSDTVSPTLKEWVNEVKTHSRLIAAYTKEMEHWQKRELESAIICGTNLVKIRMSYGDRGIGFKPFIEKEFANEFSYKTCLRYMKLANRRSDIPSDTSNIRQAYIRLGILQVDYSYPKPESNTNHQSANNDTPTNPPSQGNLTDSQPRSSKRTLNDLLPLSDSIYMTHTLDNKTDDGSHQIFEFRIDPDGTLSGRPVVITSQYSTVKPAGTKMFIKKLKPYIEWYLQQTCTNVSQFPIPQETNTSLAA